MRWRSIRSACRGSPNLAIDSSGKLYSSVPWGPPTTQSFLWKSEDGGAQWDLIRNGSPVEQRPTTSTGGADVAIKTGTPDAPGHPDALYYAELNNLATMMCAYSYDGANTIEFSGSGVGGRVCNTAAGNAIFNDRHWMAVWPHSGGGDNVPDTVYLWYDAYGLVGVNGFSLLASTDGGRNYTVRNSHVDTDGSEPGSLVVDNRSGNIYGFITTSSNGLPSMPRATAVEPSRSIRSCRPPWRRRTARATTSPPVPSTRRAICMQSGRRRTRPTRTIRKCSITRTRPTR